MNLNVEVVETFKVTVEKAFFTVYSQIKSWTKNSELKPQEIYVSLLLVG